VRPMAPWPRGGAGRACADVMARPADGTRPSDGGGRRHGTATRRWYSGSICRSDVYPQGTSIQTLRRRSPCGPHGSG
jgi:hypothetical protein